MNKKKIKDSYNVAPNKQDMKLTENVIKDLYPEYLKAYEKYENSKYSYLCNVIVCKKELLNEYCEWLFNILFELQKRMPLESYINDDYRKRMFGFISERLLNVWIIYNSNKLKIKEYYLINTDFSVIDKVKLSKL